MAENGSDTSGQLDMSLLLVDDDKPFLQRLARAMEARGYAVDTADNVAEGLKKAEAAPPAYAVVDMRLEDGNGLDVIELLRRKPAGFAHGGADRLWQHRDRRDRGEARRRRLSGQARRCRRDPRRAHPRAGEKPTPPENPMSADRVRWEHIQRVYELCDRNVSETARRLNMHRRTLQRILAKRAPR